MNLSNIRNARHSFTAGRDSIMELFEKRLKIREFLLPGNRLIDLFNPYYMDRKSIYEFLKKGGEPYRERERDAVIIDIGCGNKPYEKLFDSKSYIGVDIEESGHSKCDKKADVYYDGHTLPFADSSADLIISTQVFEHIFNIEEIISECARILKPRGKMLLTLPLCGEEHEKPYDFWRFTQYGIQKLLEEAGFIINKCEKSLSYSDTVRFLHCTYAVNKKHKRRNIITLAYYITTIISSNLHYMLSQKFHMTKNYEESDLSVNIFIDCYKDV